MSPCSSKHALAALALFVGTGAHAADIVVGVPNWPSANATAHIIKLALEQNLGLEVELQSGTNPIIFEAMDKGTMHVHPEVWLPNQQNLFDTYVADKGTVAMNPNGVEAFQAYCLDRGFAEANGISAIEDLTDPDVAALFDTDGNGKGEIWIGATGWASTNVERIRAKSYGFDQTFDLIEMDETLAFAQLDAAIKAGKGWIGFCYAPHYAFALHDLVTLKEPPHDPERWKVAQPTDDPNWLENSFADVGWAAPHFHVFYAATLKDAFPEAAAMLENMSFDNETVSAMSYEIVIKEKDVETFAAEWIAANEDKVLAWFAN